MKYTITGIEVTKPVCVQVYSHWDCTGDTTQLRVGTPFHDNLNNWYFKGNVKSLSFCGVRCPDYEPSIVFINKKDVPEPPKDPETKYITLFEQNNFKGTWFNVMGTLRIS